jgi:hypothetical protein
VGLRAQRSDDGEHHLDVRIFFGIVHEVLRGLGALKVWRWRSERKEENEAGSQM